MESDHLSKAKIFKAFCDEKRLRILELLLNGEKCTCVLNEALDIPQSTLSYHMKILCESGIVAGREEGKWTHYSINVDGLLSAMDILQEFAFPKQGQEESDSCCEATAAACGCGCGTSTAKTVLVEYLYLDLNTCERCIGTDNELDEVMTVLTPALKLAGYDVAYQKVEMSTIELAQRYRFLSSPTIRVNGRDIGGPVQENNCGCCGEISGTDVDCRVWEADGQTFEVPPREMLAEAVLRAVFDETDSSCGCNAYELPENLKIFYEGKSRGNCSCQGTCG